jgi:energy-coupling factor transporter ATP-binding protein EcfA2
MSNASQIYMPSSLMLLHASAVRVNDRACLFLGPSGTGKSTIVTLLSPIYHTIADDTVCIVNKSNGHWCVLDALDGLSDHLPIKNEVDERFSVPLLAVFRLVRSLMPSIEPLNCMETCRALTSSAFEIDIHQKLCTRAEKIAIFRTVSEISRTVPGFVFNFSYSACTKEYFAAFVTDWALRTFKSVEY